MSAHIPTWRDRSLAASVTDNWQLEGYYKDLEIADLRAALKWAIAEGNAALVERAEKAEAALHAQQGEAKDARQADVVIGAGDPMAFFAEFCERHGYPSDGDMDAALRGVFYEGIRYCSVHSPAAAPAVAQEAKDAPALHTFNSLGIAESWSVTVEANGERVLCISDQHLAGMTEPEIDCFAPTIESAARHLLGFIGTSYASPAPATLSDADIFKYHMATVDAVKFARSIESHVLAAAGSSQGQDGCAEMRARCSACGGTGDVHSFDGEWRGECDCPASQWKRDEQCAARYQLLRRGQHWSVIDGIGNTLRAEYLDAAIDASIAALAAKEAK